MFETSLIIYLQLLNVKAMEKIFLIFKIFLLYNSSSKLMRLQNYIYAKLHII